MNQINKRHSKCLDNCKIGDAKCDYYCNSMVSDQTSVSIDIQLGGEIPEIP